jgi:hypothetical protein
MTASVSTSFSALANIVLLYLSKMGVIHFYLSIDEQKELEMLSHAPEKKKKAIEELYDFKKECAFDEFDRQFNPLLWFTLGCIASVPAVEQYGFHCFWIPVGIIVFLILEIILARRDRAILCCSKNKVENVSTKNDDSEDDEEQEDDKFPDPKDVETPADNEAAKADQLLPSSLVSTTTSRQVRQTLNKPKPRSTVVVRRPSISGAPFYTAPRLSSRVQR